VNCPKCGEDWSDVAVVRNAKREALAATPALLGPLVADGCPACHHPDHDPGSCEWCPRCELHTDDAFAWVQRIDPDLIATPAPHLADCGYDEPHEPHTYVLAENDRPVDHECPGLAATPAPPDVEARGGYLPLGTFSTDPPPMGEVLPIKVRPKVDMDATPAPLAVDAPDNANAATTSANATPAPLDVREWAKAVVRSVPPVHIENTDAVPTFKRRPDQCIDRAAVLLALEHATPAPLDCGHDLVGIRLRGYREGRAEALGDVREFVDESHDRAVAIIGSTS